MLNGVNLAFVAFARYHSQVFNKVELDGQVFVLFIIALAAAEAVIGFSIMISLFRNRGTIDIDDINLMRW